MTGIKNTYATHNGRTYRICRMGERVLFIVRRLPYNKARIHSECKLPLKKDSKLWKKVLAQEKI